MGDSIRDADTLWHAYSASMEANTINTGRMLLDLHARTMIDTNAMVLRQADLDRSLLKNYTIDTHLQMK